MERELLSRRQEVNRVFHSRRRRAEQTPRGRLEFDFLQDWVDDVYPTGGWRAWLARRLAPQEVAYLDLAEVREMLTYENDSEREIKAHLKELYGVSPSAQIRRRIMESAAASASVKEASSGEGFIEGDLLESDGISTTDHQPTYVWTGYKKEESTGFVEDRSQRVVRVFKDSPKGMLIQPSTLGEFTLDQLKNARRGRPEDLIHDMQEIAVFILDHPVTGYVKPITHAPKFSVDGVHYRLQRFTPKHNPNLVFVTDKATKLRAIFAKDNEGVVFREFVDHDDLDNKQWR